MQTTFSRAATKNFVRWEPSVNRLPQNMLRSTILVLLFAGAAFAADLKITDSTNTVILLHDAFIDYGGLMGDKETDGLRIYQGEAMVTALWANIRSVTITGKTTSAEPRPTAEIIPRTGTKINTTLVSKERMRLSGKTDVGYSALDRQTIRSIEPQQQRQ